MLCAVVVFPIKIVPPYPGTSCYLDLSVLIQPDVWSQANLPKRRHTEIKMDPRDQQTIKRGRLLTFAGEDTV